MEPVLLATIVSIIAILIAAYAVIKANQGGSPITQELISASLQSSQSTAQELTDVALTAVQASEQLWRTGKIERGDRLDKAFNYVKKWFPDLDQATIITAIEAAVLVVNTLVESLPAKRAGGP